MMKRSTIELLLLAGVVASAPLMAQRPGGGPPRQVLLALDTDHDGTLSAAEIAAAPGVLAMLDGNKDGQLTSLEFLPRQADPGAANPDDLVKRMMLLDKNGDGVLTADELPERMAPMMAKLDTNHDGKLTAEEIRASAKMQTGPGGRQERGGQVTRMDPILNALDADHDGVISAAEIANAAVALKTLDGNGDGMLTPDEMKMRQMTPADRAAHMMDEWDTNKDGKLTKAECPDRMQEQFEKIDSNGDGVLDKAELTVYFESMPAGGARPRTNETPR